MPWSLVDKAIHHNSFKEYFKNFRLKYFEFFYENLSDEEQVLFSLNGLKNSSSENKDRFWKFVDKSQDNEIARIDLASFIKQIKQLTHEHNAGIVNYFLRLIGTSTTYPEAVDAIIATIHRSFLTKEDKMIILHAIAKRSDLIEALLFSSFANCKKYQLILHGLNLVFDYDLLPRLNNKIILKLHENYIGILIFLTTKGTKIRKMNHAQIIENQVWVPQFLKYVMHENPVDTLELYFRYHVIILHALDIKNLKKSLQQAKGFYIKLYDLHSNFFNHNKAATLKLEEINQNLSLWIAQLPT